VGRSEQLIAIAIQKTAYALTPYRRFLGLGSCDIATRCIANQMPLLFGDRDFEPFVQYLGLIPALPEA
jgi:hypothetical protein